MKKIITLITLICLYGCAPSKIESYLKENEPNLTTLEILEESEIDSIYSPYEKLMELSYGCMDLNTKMSELHSLAFEAKSKNESILLLDSAISIYEIEHENIKTSVYDNLSAVDYPIISKLPKNMNCIQVKYRIDGALTEQRFYFNKDDSSIRYTDIDIKEVAKSLISYLNDSHSAKREIEKDRKDINNGDYSF